MNDNRRRIRCYQCGALIISPIPDQVVRNACDRCTYSDPTHRRIVISERLRDVSDRDSTAWLMAAHRTREGGAA